MLDTVNMTLEEERLRKLRGRIAFVGRMQPCYVFRDVELQELLSAKPTTIEELSKIKGFPAEGNRVKKYGQSIVDVFRNVDAVKDFDIYVDNDGEISSSTIFSKMSLF